MPRVSVLTPVYNAEKYIGDAIGSILSQTFTDFEFIIINDGSTDNTAKIVRKYAAQDKRIKFIDSKKNLGVSAVRNKLRTKMQMIFLYQTDWKLRLNSWMKIRMLRLLAGRCWHFRDLN